MMSEYRCPNCNATFEGPDDASATIAQCPKCGAILDLPRGPSAPEGTDAAEAPPVRTPGGPPPPAVAPPLPVAEQPQSTALATAALVLGLCGIIPVVGLLCGLLALILGIIALAKGQGRLAVAGIVTGLLLPLFVNGLVLSVLLPTVGFAREAAKRVICGANLNSIGKGIALYQSEWEDSYPWILDVSRSVPLAEAVARPAGGADTLEDLGKDTRNVVENFNAMIKQASVSYRAFRCPSVGSDIAEDRIAGRAGYNDVYGFLQRESPGGDKRYYCDYAYHLGYPLLAGGKNPAPVNDEIDSNFALAADANCGEETTLSKSWNHKTDGMNVLTADLSAFWVDAEVESAHGADVYYPLVNEDNIYGAGGERADKVVCDGAPAGPLDQVLHSPR